jgi:DNA-3-methyladenine glycosylase
MAIDSLRPVDLARTLILGREFYQRPTEEVARDLLGKLLIRPSEGGVVALRVTEVEAYLGAGDPACHTFGGRRTQRTETMYGEAGHAYVYLIYGLHNCLNVVTVGSGVGEAVLIRGGVIECGHGVVRSRRGSRVAESELTDGPGKLCQALSITRDDDGLDLCVEGTGLWLADDGARVSEESVVAKPRIGVDYAGEAAGWPLRFLWRVGGIP